VAGIEGVRAASPVLRRTVSVPAELDLGVSSLAVVGVDPETYESVRPYPLVEGRWLTAADSALTEAAVPTVMAASVADTMGLSVGDTFTVPSAAGEQLLELVGTIEAIVLPGAEEIHVPLDGAQAMFELPGRISEVDATFVAGVDRAAVEEDASALLGDRFVIGAISTESPLAAGFEVATYVFSVLGVLVLAMGGFIILNTFRTVVAERRHDIGMLRALGASRRTVLGTFLTESLLQGVAGTALGILAGHGFALLVNRLMEGFLRELVNISPGQVTYASSTWALAIILGIGVTVLSALVPARAAARISPLEALRPQVEDVYERGATHRAWVGLGLIVVALVGLLSGELAFVGLSALLMLVGFALAMPAVIRPVTTRVSALIEAIYRREGPVARANILRNPGRAASTASAVMISIALIVALVGMFASVIQGFTAYAEESTGSDFIVLPRNLLVGGGTVGAGPELIEAVRATGGIAEAASLRFAQSTVDGTAVQVIGVNPAGYTAVASFAFAEGSSADDLTALADDEAILNGVFAAQAGLARGETVELATPEGPKRFRVAAIGNDYVNAKIATAYVTQEVLARLWGVTTDVLILADGAEGFDGAATLAALKATVDEYPAFQLYDIAEWRAVQAELYAQMEGIYYVLALVLAVPSLLALLNTLTIGVLARTREIGMLRAVGSTRKQVKRMVIAESLLLAVLGMVLGVLAGIWLGYVIVSALNGMGLTMPYVFPWTGIALAVVVGLLFAALASLIPARQAARMDIIRALRWE